MKKTKRVYSRGSLLTARPLGKGGHWRGSAEQYPGPATSAAGGVARAGRGALVRSAAAAGLYCLGRPRPTVPACPQQLLLRVACTKRKSLITIRYSRYLQGNNQETPANSCSHPNERPSI